MVSKMSLKDNKEMKGEILKSSKMVKGGVNQGPSCATEVSFESGSAARLRWGHTPFMK